MRGLNRYSILVVGLFILGFSPSAEASCRAVARNLGALIQRAEEKIDFLRRRGELREATFYRFEEDQLAAQTWGGVIPPRGLSDLLPEGITLIDHSLLGATEAGVVKDAGSGEFMSLRLTADGMGTNIGLGRTAILQNASRTQKSLVRENAKAVILFMHGGGTRTTGHHVAINLMNHFSSLGVDVISFDQPWHGEGPRKNFSSPKQYFDWMRKWVRDYVAVSGKPIFLAGHSMGGEFADTYMRLYPKDDLVAGVVALSSVIDPQPGSSLREKLKRMEERDEAARSDTSETPEDRLLLHSLVTQNKLSFTALLFESLFSTQTSWVIPPHGGRDYIPALYVWGAKDWLYVGNEGVVDSHIRGLPNAIVKVYGKRYDVVEKRDVDVGHIIFDHHKPGTDELEAFSDIREFVERWTGKLERDRSTVQTEDLMRKIIQTYANNLAFREFALEYQSSRRMPDQNLIAEINKRISELQTIGGSESKEELSRLNQQRQGFWLPPGVEGDLGRQWKDELDRAKKQRLTLKTEREKIKKELEAVRSSLKANDASLHQFLQGVVSEKVREILGRADQVLVQMFAQNHLIEKAINEFYLSRLESGDHNFVPPPEIQRLIDDYENLARSYQRLLSQKEMALFEDALSGSLGLEVRALYIERFGESHAGLESPGAGSLLWRERSLQARLEEIEVEISDFEEAEMRLQIQLTNKYSGELFTYETMTLQSILEKPVTEWGQYQAFIQDIWRQWQVLWRERPPSAKTSLY